MAKPRVPFNINTSESHVSLVRSGVKKTPLNKLSAAPQYWEASNPRKSISVWIFHQVIPSNSILCKFVGTDLFNMQKCEYGTCIAATGFRHLFVTSWLLRSSKWNEYPMVRSSYWWKESCTLRVEDSRTSSSYTVDGIIMSTASRTSSIYIGADISVTRGIKDGQKEWIKEHGDQASDWTRIDGLRWAQGRLKWIFFFS